MPETGNRSKPEDYDPFITTILKAVLINRPELKLKDYQDILRRRDNNELVIPLEWRVSSLV